jgi:TPR repeat protein
MSASDKTMYTANKTLEQLVAYDAQTLYEQGVFLRNGDGIEQDYHQAHRWLGMAALQGQANAQYFLGLMTMRGEGCDKNRIRALMWFYLASGLNEPRAISQSSLIASQLNARDIKEAQRQMQLFYKAQKTFRAARTCKDAQAMTELGIMLAEGQGLTQDAAQAVEWFRLAALQQFADAQCHLADAYLSGEGTELNLPEAVRLYQLAAAQNNPDAQYHLADMIEHGTGLEADAEKAIRLYQTAAAHGHVRAQLRLGFLFHSANRHDAENLSKAHHFFALAAQQGNAEGQCQLGLQFAQGLGVTQDFAQAAHWYQLASQQCHPKAQFNLGFLFAHGQGVKQDYVQAFMWYRLSTLFGYAPAQANLDFIAKKMTEAEIEKANWKADHFFLNHPPSYDALH